MTKILIVEDDHAARKGLGIRLRAHKFEAVFAIDSVAAVKTALAERPDLVILDLGLPGGDGFRVIHRFQDLAPLAEMPVIILTGRDTHTNRQRAEEMGVRAFLQKPADNDVLLARIREAIGEKKPVD